MTIKPFGEQLGMPTDRLRTTEETNCAVNRRAPYRCIHELFAAQVRQSPNAVALLCDEERLTYRELNARANRLAYHLRSLGVRAETLVGVYVERSVEYVVCILGILKAGGAYVPLDTNYPLDRLQYMLADMAAKVIVTNQPLPQGLNRPGMAVVNLATDSPLINACDEQDPDQINRDDHLAYVIYTSGSTGKPKGVAVPHRGVARLVRGQDYARFDAGQRFLLLASTSFDASTFELWGPLLNGAVCVIFSKQPLDFERLEMVIRRHGVTCLWLTAGLFNQVVDTRPSVLETVEQVLTGGEALSVPHVQKAMNLLPRVRLINGYGPTESTTFACTYAIVAGETFPNGSVPIGRPIANTSCYVLDGQFQRVPVGVAGELYIGGDGLAHGYLNQPEWTAEKFIADPFSVEPGARLYKTGDQARYLPDGNIEYLGRLDQQVKIRGFRIELGEIEVVLATHPGILKAVVLAREDVPGTKMLAAYLIVREAPGPTVTEVREFLVKRLPGYMVPAVFVKLDKLPLTPNGKVDRSSLPAPDPWQAGTHSVPDAPGSALEQNIARVWQEVLQLPITGLDHNFFDLGGDSIRLASVHTRLQGLLGRQFPVTDLFAHTTIRALAGHLNSGGKANNDGSAQLDRARLQRSVYSAKRKIRSNEKFEPNV